jgi:lincosamide nucleotidyltransferase A/C/D/E
MYTRWFSTQPVMAVRPTSAAVIFDYPPEAFDHGALGGVYVPCLSRDQQLLFHTGYEPRAIDLLDLALLEHLTSPS